MSLRRFALPTILSALIGLLACGGTSIATTSLTPSPSSTIAVTTSATPPVGGITPTATSAAVPTTGTTSATATPVPPTPVPWDTHPFYEANPACVKDGASWAYFNNGTGGSMTCTSKGVLLTVLSTINFSGITGRLPPHMTLSIDVRSMTSGAIVSLILYLNNSVAADSRDYYFDFYATGEWVMRRYNPEAIIASGSVSPMTAATLTAITSGTTRTFKINGATVASINDGLTFSAASSSAFSLGGSSGDSAIFTDLSFTP